MSKDSEAVGTIITFVKNTVANMTKNLPYDWSMPSARVIESIGDGKYRIKYNGQTYSASSLNGDTYNVGDYVFATVPQGVIQNCIIMGRR